MATDDGTPTGDEATPPWSDEPLSGRPADAAEPLELPADWPGPVSWGEALGAGGEVIRDPRELVRLGSAEADRPEGEAPGPGGRRRPGPRRPEPDHRGGGSPRRRAFLRMPGLGTLVAAGAATGLAGLVGLLVAVLFFPGAIPAPGAEEGTGGEVPVAAQVTQEPGRAVAPRTARPPARATVGGRKTARDGRRTSRTEPARERPAPAEAAGTTEVASPAPPASNPVPAPAPAPAAAPAPAVSPAEREFTPGPWNLS